MSQTQETHTDTLEGSDTHNDGEKKQKNRRPANTAFRQQRLKAWQPILTPKTVLPLFFTIGIIFAPIGGLLLWASAKVQELSIDYTNCNSTAGDEFSDIPSNKFTAHFKNNSNFTIPRWKRTTGPEKPTYGTIVNDTTLCTLSFKIPNELHPPVLLYYRLTNFYQNHRRYVKSLDTDQLKGKDLSNSTIDGSSCNPLKNDHNGKAYYPCGLIANSIFNDTFRTPVFVPQENVDELNHTYAMTSRGIAWSSDGDLYKKTKYKNDQVSPPPNWQKRYPNGYTEDNPIPDISQYEEFQVWMRTAGLPTFSKLALRNDKDVMEPGFYQLDILDYFPVKVYGGTKEILISTRTVMGGKNSFLGIAYVVVGGVCVVLGVLFTVAHLVKPRKLGDHTYLTWNTEQPSTATTTGRDSRPGTM